MRFLFIFLLLFTSKALSVEFFVGLGYTNLGDRYRYSNLEIKQYVGSVGPLTIGEYIDVNIPRGTSFGQNSALSGNGVVVNFGTKFNIYKKFFYTAEVFANYTGAKTVDKVVAIPEVDLGSNFVTSVLNGIPSELNGIPLTSTGLIALLPKPLTSGLVGALSVPLINNLLCGTGNKDCNIVQANIDKIKPELEKLLCPNGECKVPSYVVPITYRMSANIGFLSRTGYDFKNFSFNILHGATLTVFDVENGDYKERIYKGRFIAGLGVELPIGDSKKSKIYFDYKYYIPLEKDIVREYPDAQNPGKTSRVKISNFAAETQAFEVGLKYYF